MANAPEFSFPECAFPATPEAVGTNNQDTFRTYLITIKKPKKNIGANTFQREVYSLAQLTIKINPCTITLLF